MIVDTGDELLKVQCKSSSNPIRNGVRDLDAFHFSTVTQTTNTKETIRRRYDDEQIDYFATCYDNKVYLVTDKTLRLKPPANNSGAYNKAEDYLLENMLGHKVSNSFVKSSEESEPLPKVYICSQCNTNKVSKANGICVECATKNAQKTYKRATKRIN